MLPIGIVVNVMKHAVTKTLAKQALGSTVKNRLIRKIVTKGSGSTFKGFKLKGINKGTFASIDKKDLVGKYKKLKHIVKTVRSPSIKKITGLVDIEKMMKWINFTEKQIRTAKIYGDRIKKVNKIKNYYKRIINLTNYTTHKTENKIVDLLFHIKDEIKTTNFAKKYDLDKFERKLTQFQKNKKSVHRFNRMMNDDYMITNVKIGLFSSWLFWGIWTPITKNSRMGTMVLRVKPWVSKSSKNPSLTYNYGVEWGTPNIHYDVWKAMDAGRAGTQFWRKYKGVKQKRKRRK